MKDKKIYIILIMSFFIVVLGISYAYFALKIIGNDSAKNNKVISGTLELTFNDSVDVSLDNAIPGDFITKTIKVTNTGTIDVSYNIGWIDYTNEIINNELVIEGTCKRLNSSNTEEGTCNGVSQKVINGSNIISNISIEPNITHEYTLKITFIDTGKPQNYNKNKSFNGKLNITESTVKTVYCTYEGDMVQGAEYVNDGYTYKYMMEGVKSSSELNWSNISNDGWGVQLTDKTSTNDVNGKLCTYINDKPVISMANMFSNSAATNINLSSFDTSNVINMSYMFGSSSVTSLNLSNFNTSKVTNMFNMFENSKTNTLDLSSFDTSNVTNMNGMFFSSDVTDLNISNFNTSSVINMGYMFFNTKMDIIDLSNFITSNVTDMGSMFRDSVATSIIVSSFDTSKVKDMSYMFGSSRVTTLDVSSFDTSKVVNMSSMFFNSTKLKTIYASDKFNTSAVTSSADMFKSCNSLVGSEGTLYNESYIDKTYARIDKGTSSPGYFTSK